MDLHLQRCILHGSGATGPAGGCLDDPAPAADDRHASGWNRLQTLFT